MDFVNPDECPMYWERLSDQDKRDYMNLKKTLASPTCKNRRNRSVQTFSEILEAIKDFVVKGDKEGDHDRSLVCGICWLDDKIAVNIRQLRLILSKCKSSINNSFQQLGYGTIPQLSNSSNDLIRYFPELENHFPQLRNWTVRQLIKTSPAKLADIVAHSCAAGSPSQIINQYNLQAPQMALQPQSQMQMLPVDSPIAQQVQKQQIPQTLQFSVPAEPKPLQ